MDETIKKALEKPFPNDKVKEKRGQGGRTMSYISHGLITERLNDADPGWSSEKVAEHTYVGHDGLLHCAGVTIALTVGGVTRVESGGPQRQDGFTNEIKNAYSDALKRAAMRFGVALGMWERLIDAEYDEDVHPDYTPPSREQQIARAEQVADDAVHRFHQATDIDEKIAAGAVAVAARGTARALEQRPNGNGQGGGNPLTPPQLKLIQTLATKKKMSDEQLNGELSRFYPERASLTQLTIREASAFIDHLHTLGA